MNTILSRLAIYLAPLVAKQLAPLIPVIAAAVAKTVLDRLGVGTVAVPEIVKDSVNNVLEFDPDIPFISDIFDLSEFLKGRV